MNPEQQVSLEDQIAALAYDVRKLVLETEKLAKLFAELRDNPRDDPRGYK